MKINFVLLKKPIRKFLVKLIFYVESGKQFTKDNDWKKLSDTLKELMKLKVRLNQKYYLFIFQIQ